MAIIHRADITPSKRDLIDAWLEKQPWSGTGETEILGSYRFDDPDGEVGMEAMIVRRGETTLHVPLTYRAAPLPGAEAHCLGTMDHSVLGRRWVHDAVADPVAVGCFVRALRGEQQQAIMEVWEGETMIEQREPTARVHAEASGASEAAGSAGDDVSVVDVDLGRLHVVRVIGAAVPGRDILIADCQGAQSVVAALAG